MGKKMKIKIDEQAINALYCTALSLWSAVLTGNPTSKQKSIYNYMKTPKIGEFVIESTSSFLAIKAWNTGKHEAAINHMKSSMGILEEIANEEWDMTSEERKEYLDNDQEIPVETIYYIRNLYDIRFRWKNASFLNIPTFYPIGAN